MRSALAGLAGAALTLALAGAARADIPPPPPPGLRDSPGLRPLPLALAGAAAALAVAVCGVVAVRHRRHPVVLVAALAATAAVLAVTGLIALRAARDRDEQAALRARYEKDLANWRPLGPVRPPRPPAGVPRAVAVLALAPQDGFPQGLPWAALALHGTATDTPPAP
jgi:hypothetical protein